MRCLALLGRWGIAIIVPMHIASGVKSSHSNVKRSFLTPLLLLLACVTLRAQTFDMRDQRVQATYMQGLWRFHTGDDPAWASPSFDDSHWSLLRSYETWGGQGYPNYGGLAWYRFKVIVPAYIPSLTLELPPINNCYQVFANGQLIGGYGKMPPDPVAYSGGAKVLYQLPDIRPRGDKDATIVFAIRVWEWSTYAGIYGGGPLYGGATIGSTVDVERLHQREIDSMHWQYSSDMILAILEALAALGALTLFLLRRSEREYFWFALIMLCSASGEWLKLSYIFAIWPIQLRNQIEAVVIGPGLALAAIAFYFRLLHSRRTPFFWIAVIASLCTIPFNLFGGLLNLKLSTWYLGQDLLGLPTTFWILAMLFSRARSNLTDARLLAAPVLLQKGTILFQQACVLTFALGWQNRLAYWVPITTKPFEIEVVQVVDALFLLTMLAILVLRFTRTSSLQERYALEVEGARSVQRFLIPDVLPDIPGLTIQSEYRPAREVGGDFFQILPDPQTGSTLIVVGDVAGKGLEAGMLATLIVGAIRTAATFTDDPALILSTINDRLHSRGNATCLALRIAAAGRATLVNAGHLPPYLNGEELPMDGALPLGILPGIQFPVLNFQLAEGDSLMLMSDGVAEAQGPDGELFGFDRIYNLLRGNSDAAELASAAQAFGQSDDITVLTIARTITPVEAALAAEGQY